MFEGKRLNILAVALATVALAGIASGQDFVNGSFETGDLTGWTTDYAMVTGYIEGGDPIGYTYPTDGSYFAFNPGILFQTVPVAGGTHLTADFNWRDTYQGKMTVTLYNTSSSPTIDEDFIKGYADGAVYKRSRAWYNMTDWRNAQVDLTSEGYVTLVAHAEGGSMALDDCSLSIQPTPAPQQPRVTTVEVIAANGSTLQQNNNCQVNQRVVRTSDDVFAIITPETHSPLYEQQWQLVKRNGGSWDVVATGQQGPAVNYIWVSPDETLHVLGYPNNINPDGKHHLTMWTGQWDANTESITMTPQEVPDMAPANHMLPRLMAGGDTKGHLVVSSTYDYAVGNMTHYYAIYDANTKQWTATNSMVKDTMYTYNWFFPHEDGQGVTYVNPRTGLYSYFGYTSPPYSEDWGGIPHYGLCLNQTRLWRTDNLATTVPQTLFTETIEPSYPGEFVFNFPLDAYQDQLGRIFVISSRVGGGYGTATDDVQDFHYWLKVLSPDGTLLHDMQLPDPTNRYAWDTADAYKMFQDATGKFWLLCGHDATLRSAGYDGVTIGDPIQLDFGYDQLWWNISIANSRSGNGLSNTIDLTFAARPNPYNWPGDNNSLEYLYAQIEIPEIGPGDCDRDGDVDNVDFGALYGSFTGPENGGSAMYWSNGDFDLDGDVDNVDFGVLYGNYTGPLAGGTHFGVTPEPGTWALVAIGSVAMRRGRRKV